MRLSSHFRPATRMDTGSSEALIYFCMQEKRSMLSCPRRRESIATRNAVVDSRLRGNDGLWQFIRNWKNQRLLAFSKYF